MVELHAHPQLLLVRSQHQQSPVAASPHGGWRSAAVEGRFPKHLGALESSERREVHCLCQTWRFDEIGIWMFFWGDLGWVMLSHLSAAIRFAKYLKICNVENDLFPMRMRGPPLELQENWFTFYITSENQSWSKPTLLNSGVLKPQAPCHVSLLTRLPRFKWEESLNCCLAWKLERVWQWILRLHRLQLLYTQG